MVKEWHITVSIYEADFYEHFFYILLIKQGFILLQLVPDFTYKRKKDSEAIRHQGVRLDRQIILKKDLNIFV